MKIFSHGELILRNQRVESERLTVIEKRCASGINRLIGIFIRAKGERVTGFVCCSMIRDAFPLSFTFYTSAPATTTLTEDKADEKRMVRLRICMQHAFSDQLFHSCSFPLVHMVETVQKTSSAGSNCARPKEKKKQKIQLCRWESIEMSWKAVSHVGARLSLSHTHIQTTSLRSPMIVIQSNVRSTVIPSTRWRPAQFGKHLFSEFNIAMSLLYSSAGKLFVIPRAFPQVCYL